jgi:uncharacterized protein YyaL (SSP411 family)
LKLFYPALERQASGFVSLATALDEYLAPPAIVILRGNGDAVTKWRQALAGAYRPATLVLGIPAGTSGLPGVLDKAAPAAPGAVNAWVCRGVTCLAPIAELAELERVLGAPAA